MKRHLRILGIGLAVGMAWACWAGSLSAEAPAAAAPAAPAPVPDAMSSATPVSAAAETPAPVSNEEMLLMDIGLVTTASKQAESAKLSPATILVITAKQIRDRGYLDLKDILYDLPGMDLTPNIGTENGGWQVIPRGLLGLNKIQVLQDGVPLNPAGGDKFVWGYNLTLDHVERVEVLYGPVSALYGSDAMGGVINVITKKGEEIDGVRIKALGGSGGTAAGSVVYGKKFANGVDWVAAIRSYNAKGFDFKTLYPEVYRDLPADSAFETPVYDYNLFSKLSYQEFTLELSRAHSRENTTRAKSPLMLEMDHRAAWIFDTDLAVMKHAVPLGESVQLISTLSYHRYQVDNDSNYQFHWSEAYKQVEEKQTKLEEQLNWDLGRSLKVTLGAEAAETASLPYAFDLLTEARSDQDQVQWMPNPTYGYLDAAGNTVAFRGNSLLSIRTFGAYLQAKYYPFETLSLTAGGRYDYNSYYGFNVFNPRVGVVYQPVGQATVKLLYGTAFISPSIWANNIFWMAPGYGHVTPETLGIKLKPETLDSVELNVSYEAAPNWVSTLDVYYSKLKDLLQGQYVRGDVLNILATPTSAPSPTLVETAANLGDQNIVGADLMTTYAPTPGLEICGSYSYVGGKTNHPANVNLPLVDTYKVATHKGIVSVTYKAFDHFSLFVRERLTGEMITSPLNQWAGADGDAQGNNRLAGYAVTDLNLRIYDYPKGVEFFVRVENVFDVKYYGVGIEDERYAYHGSGAGNFLPKVPFDPRTVLAGVSASF